MRWSILSVFTKQWATRQAASTPTKRKGKKVQRNERIGIVRTIINGNNAAAFWSRIYKKLFRVYVTVITFSWEQLSVLWIKKAKWTQSTAQGISILRLNALKNKRGVYMTYTTKPSLSWKLRWKRHTCQITRGNKSSPWRNWYGCVKLSRVKF